MVPQTLRHQIGAQESKTKEKRDDDDLPIQEGNDPDP